MRKTYWLWVFAFVITIASAVYQRMTGPTYPVSGEGNIYGKHVTFKFDRAHVGNSNHLVKVKVDDSTYTGSVFWKRYKTNDEWTKVKMNYKEGYLVWELPHQPPAGKLVYNVNIKKENMTLRLNKEPIVIRFRGDVPSYILVPHVIFMFLAMLLSTRAGLEFFNSRQKYKPLTIWTIAFLLIGGLIFGPIVQKYSFGAYWTGVPFGYDLTDNKTLIAFLGWIIAFIAIYKSNKAKVWVLIASLLTLIIFLIPHSVLGSELDYNKIDKQKNLIEKMK
jgi:hypothetical protein